MKGSGLLSVLSFLVFVSLSAAWPSPESFEHIEGLMMRRQDSSDGSPSTTATATGSTTNTQASTGKATSPENSASASSRSGGSVVVNTGSSGSQETGAAQTSSSNSNSTTHEASETTAIDPRLPPGGVQMVTPAPFAGAQYYKIGDHVTFAWNYTSLSVTPSAIDILASCAINSQLYTIALNQSIDATGAVTWDTGGYQSTATVPLLTETYTLVIYDAAKDISATPSAGYLGVYDQYTFGMYTPQAYTPLNEFKCATCSGALSDHERQALGFLLGMSVMTILSFSWFAGGFGVFS